MIFSESKYEVGDKVECRGKVGIVRGVAVGNDGSLCLRVDCDMSGDPYVAYNHWRTWLWRVDECKKVETAEDIREEVRKTCSNKANCDWVLSLLDRYRKALERE